jgi:hypothetical protein
MHFLPFQYESPKVLAKECPNPDEDDMICCFDR